MKVKYQLEYHPNPDCLSIHVSKKLTDSMIESFESADWDTDKQTPLVRDLFAIDGITEVSLQKYEIHVIKGKVFEWEDLLPQITLVMQMHLAPEEPMDEKAAPMRYYLDHEGFRRDLPLATDQELHHSTLFSEGEGKLTSEDLTGDDK